MIRKSTPEDTPEIARLALAQYQRTPWPADMVFPDVKAFIVNQRAGHIAACCGYRWDGRTIRVMHVWAEDGFSGQRAAVELMKLVQRLADEEGSELVFTARAWNAGLRNAVERHGCEGSPGEEPEQIVYRRGAS
jgi:N-acetylglutamate synthase-like GNAT family acetyltransferase